MIDLPIILLVSLVSPVHFSFNRSCLTAVTITGELDTLQNLLVYLIILNHDWNIHLPQGGQRDKNEEYHHCFRQDPLSHVTLGFSCHVTCIPHRV